MYIPVTADIGIIFLNNLVNQLSCIAFIASIIFTSTICLADASHLGLHIVEDAQAQTISVYREGDDTAYVVQNTKADFRPYIHPIVAPDGKGVLTQYSPGHHKHQTGLYWGFTRVNGRDYFHHPEGTYWEKVSAKVLKAKGEKVQWQTVYHLLDSAGRAVMQETQQWSVADTGKEFLMDLDWSGKALVDINIGKYNYGGLFLRMPYKKNKTKAEAMNANRLRNNKAEGKNAVWMNVSMEIEGRDDWGSIAIFDHNKNPNFPAVWRVDKQFGVGPAASRKGAIQIKKGETLSYKHRIVVYTGRLNDIHLTEHWKQWTGQRYNVASWKDTRKEALNATFLTGEQAVAKMTSVDGIEPVLYASEPEVTQPMAFCWDDRGRLWIAENRDYETRRKGFSKFGDSRISILEDTDGDGKVDKKKVFLDGIPFPSAIAIGFDGLWLGSPPNLLFVPDRNHDDKADDDIEVRLTGWGIRDRHEVVNSLCWGPDGWLYGSQGYATPSNVGKPKDGGRILKPGEPFPTKMAVIDPQYIDGGFWRYHPTKDRFEVVAHGFSNPWGLDWNDKGQLFSSMCVIPHLWHIVHGGIYHRQGGQHINPYVYDDIKTIGDHRHRSAHGGMRIYQADLLPAKYRGQAFMANMHEHRVLSDTLTPKGSGYTGHHGDDFLEANDPQWIGFSMETGPEGAVYVLDWHDADICGNSVQNKDTGRIYRLAPPGTKGVTNFNVADLTDAELVQHQLNSNEWWVRRARMVLQYRASVGKLSANVTKDLWEMFKTQKDEGRKLRALWTLHGIGAVTHGQYIDLLDHKMPYVRAWVVQLLCEDKTPGKKAIKKFIEMAKADDSAVVRLYLAAAMQRVPESAVWPIAKGLISRAEDNNDHNIPKMIWFGIESQVGSDPATAIEYAVACKLHLVTKHIARRGIDARKLEETLSAIVKVNDDTVLVPLLEGVSAGAHGLGSIAVPTNWPPLEKKLATSNNQKVKNFGLQIGQAFGSAAAVHARLKQLNDPATPLAKRIEIVNSFAVQQNKIALPFIEEYLNDQALGLTAIKALAAYPHKHIADAVLSRYKDFNTEEKQAAIATLTARKFSAGRLWSALDGKTPKVKIPKGDISAINVRQMTQLLGPAFKDWWGKHAPPKTDKEKTIARYKNLLTDDYVAKADLPNGKRLFQSCAACHVLYGKGGNIGPELTGSNRGDLDYILGNIIDPSADIGEGYQLVVINTKDGRMIQGNIKEENDQKVVISMIGQVITIPKSEIMSLTKNPISLMPEGLINGFTDEQVRDLIGYLRTTQDIDASKEPAKEKPIK